MLAATYGHTDGKIAHQKGCLEPESNEKDGAGSRAACYYCNRGWNGNTALVVTMAGNVECVEILVAAGANKEEEGYGRLSPITTSVFMFYKGFLTLIYIYICMY